VFLGRKWAQLAMPLPDPKRADKSGSPLTSEAVRNEVRAWIERVIVPALVSKLLQERGSTVTGVEDNAKSMQSSERQNAPVANNNGGAREP
jgi:hypothetical protein